MNILSIQSWVSYGHVGNAAALFPLQRLGAEVWAVNTVQFSNHPGYGAFTGRPLGGAAVAELLSGIAARGALERLDAILSGYLGDAETGAAVLDIVARTRLARPGMLYCCDPVMGDRGTGLYVQPAVASLLHDRAVGAADILTPNQFELEQLTPGLGSGTAGIAELVRAAQALRGRMHPSGPCLVLVTSVVTPETPIDAIDLLLATGHGSFLLRTPRLALAVNGAGDLIAALFLYHVLQPGARHAVNAVAAMQHATNAVLGVLRHTIAAGSRELLIVQAQDELIAPSQTLTARQI